MLPAVAIALLILTAAVMAALLIIGVVGVVRMRRRRPPVVRPGGPLPVILVHGLFGFDHIGIPGARLHYFRGIVQHLATLGCHAHAVRLSPAASVPERAKQLVAKIEALGHDRVDIIAHSLGGLDARYALTHLGLATRVRSLVTVGTPHRGTPLADLAAAGPLALARRAVTAIGIPLTAPSGEHAIDWLTTKALEDFNRDVVDAPGVYYACVVGGIRDEATPIALAIAPIHAYLRRVSGANDGLVPMSSQYWGATLAEIEADHFAQIGWKLTPGTTFDALGLYAFVVSRLGDLQGNLPGWTPRTVATISSTAPRDAG